MISVLLLGLDQAGQQPAAPGAAVRTLAALVPAIVDGVVRDLCLAGPHEDRGLSNVADHAGCAFVTGADFTEAIRLGAKQLRCPHVLVARSGVVIDRQVIEELSALLPTLDAAKPQFHVLRAERRDLLGRLFPGLAPPAALLGARSWLGTVAAPGFGTLVGKARPRRNLKATAWIAA